MKRKSTAMSSTLRCLKVLEFLAEEPFELTFTDIAAKLDSPKASAHRLCTTLMEANLITQQPVTRRYMLNSHALWVGSGYLRHSPLYRAAFFPMQELARQVPGTVQLGVLDQDYVLFIHSVGYSGAPHAFADVGLRRPLNATASGKIFLVRHGPLGPGAHHGKEYGEIHQQYNHVAREDEAGDRAGTKGALCAQCGRTVAGVLGACRRQWAERKQAPLPSSALHCR